MPPFDTPAKAGTQDDIPFDTPAKAGTQDDIPFDTPAKAGNPRVKTQGYNKPLTINVRVNCKL
jgi:hypothetical protein